MVYALVGIAGFFVTGFENFASETDKTLLGFEINPLHNIVHLAIGVAGLMLWRRLDTSRTYGWLLAVGYGLAFLYGLFAAGNSDINFLSLNGADNGLHLVSAAAGWPSPCGRPTGPPPAPPTAAPRTPTVKCRDGQTTTT